jgi:hypothetical protein
MYYDMMSPVSMHLIYGIIKRKKDAFSVNSVGANKNKHITEYWHEKLSEENLQDSAVPCLKTLNKSVLLQNNSQLSQGI